ncbi:zinc-dependent alcohol dehydrogenase [Ammoniphilus resinae]|uniref:L-iditol 2-dehydrogenase n=1 Tax=Ammoniphilus resinae TaxID=861532 RepID=A0ABS4GXH5_9BACL|nr:alcohol dehydrogenase catalytic domain-containing protein [Ammoniphilus resinae]MBP1934570.1 L-iditol 2-dehydrogenase [Ammoniphilus resinae]
MKAVLVESPYQVVVKDVTDPVVGDYDVRIKVKAAGICGSDIHTYKGIHPFRKPPVIIGHEVAGDVVEVGSKVTRIKIGDRVTVEPQAGCGVCEDCINGRINYCGDRLAPGVKNWYGSMAEYFVAPESTVFVLPDVLNYHHGVVVEPFAVGVHAVFKGGVSLGDRVAILGAGPIGLLTQAAAIAAGATTILTTDVFDYALEAARDLGATSTLNIRQHADWVSEAKKLVGGSIDIVFIAAGVPGIVNQALSLLRRGGKIITVAMFHEEQALDIMQLQGQEKEIVGSYTYTRKDMLKAIQLLAAGKVKTESLISHVLPYSQADLGFRLVERKEDRSLKVLIEF